MINIKQLEKYCVEHGWELYVSDEWPIDHWMSKYFGRGDYELTVKKPNRMVSKKLEISMNLNEMLKQIIEYDKNQEPQKEIRQEIQLSFSFVY